MTTTETEEDTPRFCPECGRPWLYGLSYRHRVDCALYTADSATTAADHQRGRGIRPATETETILAAALGITPGPDETLTVTFAHDGIHDREVTTEKTEESTNDH